MGEDVTRLVIAAGGGALAAAIAWLVTRRLISVLRRWEVLDAPNQRSSHTRPTPRGGGLAVVPIVAVAWLLLAVHVDAARAWLVPVAVAALGLAVVFWRDDVGGLSVGVRLAAQAAAVGAVLFVAPPHAGFFGGWLPPVADAVLAGILWMWFINLFNFMDGIDGISGVETAAIGIGAALVTLTAGLGDAYLFAGTALAGAAAGFLAWNWQPARIFLGDVGSVPLGFMIGWLLLQLAAAGEWAAALILPAYYLVDSGVTLGRRFMRGERVWRAHREHFYQRAVARGMSHAGVARHVLVCDIMLIGLAVLAAAGRPQAALAGAALTVAALLMVLAGPGRWRRASRRTLDARPPPAVRERTGGQPQGPRDGRTENDSKDIPS